MAAGRSSRLLAAVVAGVALLVVALIAVALAGLLVRSDEPWGTSTITDGDCFAEFSAFEAEPGVQTTIGPVNPADCAAPHALEAYYVGTAYVGLGEEYPLLDVLDDVAITECEKRFESFVDAEWQTSELDFWWLTPSQEGWEQGDRELICLVGDYEKALTSGSLVGAGR